MSKHTEIPWICHSGMIWRQDFRAWPDGIPIARMDRETEHTSPTERDANAKHTVHCVNLYDEMLASLKELSVLITSKQGDTMEAHIAALEALAVIAKAEKES